MAKRKAQRKRTAHPGVVLRPPRPERRWYKWRARYTDPDTGRQRTESLPDDLDAKGRRQWAVDKYVELQARKAELQTGAVRKQGLSLAWVLNEHYFEQHGPGLRPRTLKAHRELAEDFVGFCGRLGVHTADQVTGEVLARYADFVRRKRKRAVKAGAGRGVWKDTALPRSPATISRELRGLKAMLQRQRKAKLLPLLTSDTITDALEAPPTPGRLGQHLSRAEIRELWDATRATPDFVMGALLRVALLTGMRASEIKGLRWAEVDLDDRNIVLQSERTKTRRPRVIDLAVSPSVVLDLARCPQTGPYVFGGERPLGDIRRRIGKITRWQLQDLRRTCSTYLCCMSSYGPHRSAGRLGHSIAVAESRYASHAVRVPRACEYLEAAFGLPGYVSQVLDPLE